MLANSQVSIFNNKKEGQLNNNNKKNFSVHYFFVFLNDRTKIKLVPESNK